VISLPMGSLYLQDRRAADVAPRGPSWRGRTLVWDLLDSGVLVACASDSVREACFAYGDFELLGVYAQSVKLAHLDTRLWQLRGASAAVFNRTKGPAVAGLALNLRQWLVASITMGGEWCLRWQSTTWNRQDAAGLMFMVVGITLLFSNSRDEEAAK
jgi:predicted small integral membrane protein